MWNILQVVIALLVLGFATNYFLDIGDTRTITNGLFVHCGRIEKKMEKDDLCRKSDDCQLTRDDLVDSRERVDKYYKYCSKRD